MDGGSAVSEIVEHATNPKHIQSIIVLRIVGPITIPTLEDWPYWASLPPAPRT